MAAGYKTFFRPPKVEMKEGESGIKVGEGTRDTSENHKKQITAMAADMVAFMNTPECGAVSGITFDYRSPGNAVGAVVHGPAAEGKANAVPASTGWSAEVFSGHTNGLNNHARRLWTL